MATLVARAPRGRPHAGAAEEWSLGRWLGGTGSSALPLLSFLLGPQLTTLRRPPAARTQITMGATMLAATGLALPHHWRGQFAGVALPPAALAFGCGQGHGLIPESSNPLR